jgi:hypothetical protein
VKQELQATIATQQATDLHLNYTLIQKMSYGEIMDRVFDAWDRWDRKCPRHRSMERREYNWWVDIYNFKAGKLILRNK